MKNSKRFIQDYKAKADEINHELKILFASKGWPTNTKRLMSNHKGTYHFAFKRKGSGVQIARSVDFDTAQERNLAYAAVLDEFGVNAEDDDKFFESDEFSFGADIEDTDFEFGLDIEEDGDFEFGDELDGLEDDDDEFSFDF